MKPSKTQQDHNLDFNGQGDGVSYKELSQYRGNQHTGRSNTGELIQERQMPNRRGNEGKLAGPATAAGKGNPTREGGRSWKPSATENYVGNPDMINTGNPITRGNPR